MTGRDSSHRQNGDKVLDLPTVRDERCLRKNDHADNEEKREKHGEFELKEAMLVYYEA